MLYYCLSCIKEYKKIESKNPKQCAVCDSKKLRFIKEHGTSGLLSNLTLKIPSSKIPTLGDILFKRYKMN